ncbi:MAG TPA: S53 family peptidase [Candidatus Thermoplasmatota archaeon]|nr:S53 family peptidase [Candidatus Thermoplasmatota archaeon]
MRAKLVATTLALLLLAVVALPAIGASPSHSRKHGSVSPLADRAVDDGLALPTQPVAITIGLDLRNKDLLDAFIAQASDPASPLFQHWLTQEQFNLLYGPTADQEAAVIAWLAASGFTVTQTFSNRLLVSAVGDAAAVQKAFQVDLHKVRLDGVAGLAILDDPSFPSDIAAFTTGVMGLDDLAKAQPHRKDAQAQPHDNLGTSCCYFSPRDLNNAYNEDHNGAHTGAGQTLVIVGAYDFKTTDFTAFNTQMGLPNPAVTRVCAGGTLGVSAGCKFNGPPAGNSIEISLDVEYAHGTAPSAALVSIMAKSAAITDFTTAYNTVVTRNDGHSVSTSWGLCETQMAAASRSSDDNIFANAAAIGQSWFAASGDAGSNDCSGAVGVDYPASSPYVMGVGGTHLTCPAGSFTPTTPVCSGYGSETGWTGSGGGNSAYYAKPSWQTGCSVPTGNRHVPDVALEADTAPGNLVAYNGGWYAVGGTSDASPQLAGMFAALNQAKGGSGLGLPGVRLYQLCAGTSFHDVTSGSNGGFTAAAGYDRVTGIGTINEGNLITNY